ncbi:uncharacterized protein LOC121369518 [Gigantopelta aegis]|uniref:uncharacterized protein LOC121369518 n=1 Tax=Gigantopelta aegis TaxID=1735272 RepID=UPI001B88C72C|nr:uncharacterized protein LOC121369518 [Gigantopelta aegis]
MSIKTKMMKLAIIAVALVTFVREGHGLGEGGKCSESSEIMFTDPTGDCSKFYRCDSGRYNSYVCTAGMVFDRTQCIWPEMSKSTCKTPTRGNVPLIPVDQSTKCVYPCPATASMIYPDWANNQKLYVCKNGNLFHAACVDASGGIRYHYFDPIFKSCDGIKSNRNINFV